ncbi:hypothetical protein Acr_00g0064520 [Actinidia rufa]|uniref:Retrotransposon gag domain-containing protein n=1 Tax=Actinidia rufa TaxID=165716 RepID=A0A7J0DQY3_9ERIC|nr:hypothetical protein Acr_00g0064520 [Actinidia rufa]
MIPKVAKARVGHIPPEVDTADHQVCIPSEKEVISFWNHGPQAELLIQVAKKLREEEDHLVVMIDPPNAGIKALISQIEPLFMDRVMKVKVSSRFKLPSQLRVYKGKTDPIDHLDSYENLMLLQGYSNVVMCKAFSLTLRGPTRSWFKKLSPKTIDSFGNLSKLFVSNFMSCRIRQKNASHLFTIHQKEGESLKDYVKQFNQVVLEVKHPNDKVVVMTIMEGLHLGGSSSSFWKSHAREANGRVEEQVYNLSMPINEVHQTAAFTNDDLRGLHLSHDDPLVVFATIANFNV